MKSRVARALRVSVGWYGLLVSALTSALAAPNEIGTYLKNLPWRNVGPAIMGGRINDIEVVEDKTSTVYLATASAGVWRTTNNGTTWEPIFDNQTTSSIGDMDVARSNPDILWVGTGEANNRQSSSWGDGIYKSTDGGKTWQNMGLRDTHHIGRVIIHPANPDVVWVAAAGRLWAASKERGLYKTTDGGKTWKNTLFLNEDTGCIDLAIDPADPNTLYAATYQRRRAAFGFNGGGPHSGLYKSTDGGETWKKLTNGLPTGDIGRIGVDVYRKDPRIVYCIVETKNGSISGTNNGSIFRSEDKGETWTKMSDTNPRPMYYSQIRIDPNNDKILWVLGASMYISRDGGKTFSTGLVNRIHGDYHDVWINPADSNHTLAASDGGIHWSYDAGRTWDFVNTIPLAQFYEICFDMRKPYYVYGGLQDNGSWGGPSRTPTVQGVTNEDWYRVGGGDGFYVQVDPTDHNILYVESQNGFLQRMNQATGEAKRIRPNPRPGELPYRFDWNSPILISPHNPKKILFGGNRLFISYDRGDSWPVRTPDLSKNQDRNKMPIMGRLTTRNTLSRHDGQDTFGQIVTVSESPLKEGVIYVGTDDGNLQISQDNGASWKLLTVPGVPEGTYVSRVHASAHNPGRAYVAFDGHRSNDFKPYLFVTEDYGATWQPITNGIPEGSTISVIRDHPRTPTLLFCGTERGLYLSFDRGISWIKPGAPLPMVPVDDIQIHPRENDLILGTHGRGIYILDDIAPLEKLATTALQYDVTLCPPALATAYRIAQRKGSTGHKFYIAENPTSGATINYFLRGKMEKIEAEKVQVAILDLDGKSVVRELRTTRVGPGWNRVVWDLRAESPAGPMPIRNAQRGGQSGRRTRQPGQTTAQSAQPGQLGQAGRSGGSGNAPSFFVPRGHRVLPGTYTVRLTVDGTVYTAPITVEEDPRLKLSASERKAYYGTLERLSALYGSADRARRSLQEMIRQLEDVQKSEDFKKSPKATQDSLTGLLKQATELQTLLATARTPGGAAAAMGLPVPDEEPRPALRGALIARIGQMMNTLDSLTEAPSRAIRQDCDALAGEVRQMVKTVNDLNGKMLPALNKQLKASSIKPLAPGEKLSL
jgi:photosystem II stability/assembly factor-like uncharacterized protein